MIFSISGRIGSGKDLTGNIIQYLIGYNGDAKATLYQIENNIKDNIQLHTTVTANSTWEIKKWADSLKDIVCILTGCTREQLEDIDFKNSLIPEEYEGLYNINNTVRQCITYRQLLQYLGTNLLRNQLHENVWVNALIAKYKCTSCDMRVPFEDGIAHVEWDTCVMPNWIITDTRFPNEAKTVSNKGGINIRLTRFVNENDNALLHESETSLDFYKFDYIVDNRDGNIENLIRDIKVILVKEGII